MSNFYERLVALLKNDGRFFSKDGDSVFLRNAAYNAAMQMDSSLIKLLLSDEEVKAHFFKEVDGVLVFDKIQFGWVVNNRQFLPDSYTRFKNKIGLVNERNELISGTDNVELVFPYKDCVLEGGQTKEEQKRNEIFYNELLAPDEAKKIVEPKVFSNIKKHTIQGVETVVDFSDDNLVIKGNNLLAIASLLPRFKGQIKCIYIDPPYNTSDDSFRYNDTFTHSAWLTFMKNRLEIAMELLKDDGLLFINIDDNEEAYLSVLLDELFAKYRDGDKICKFDKISVKTSSSQGGFGDVNPGFISNVENILLYVKNPYCKTQCFNESNMYVAKTYDENYKYYMEDLSTLKYVSIKQVAYKRLGIPEPYNSQTWRRLKDKYGNDYKDVLFKMQSEIAMENKDKVFRTFNPNKPSETLKQKLRESKMLPNQIITDTDSEGKPRYILNGEVLLFYSKIFRNINGEIVPAKRLSTLWDDIPWEGIASEGAVTLRNGKKPEKLLKRIIETSTQQGDIVLDFFAGSGTALAVAHKLGRRYIGIEQLNYGENDLAVRLSNVITGDKSGISSIVNWQGGGSFVYCELATLNQRVVEDIEKAKDTETLKEIYQKMKKTGFISCKVNVKDIDSNISEFESLSLDNQKRFLLELLDKNLLYVNLCDIDDEEFAISEQDKKFTKSFYGIE